MSGNISAIDGREKLKRIAELIEDYVDVSADYERMKEECDQVGTFVLD